MSIDLTIQHTIQHVHLNKKRNHRHQGNILFQNHNQEELAM